MHRPKSYRGIMLSSTFRDLEQHRQRANTAIRKAGFRENVMENDTARTDADVIDSSLQMVRDSVAYILVIGRRYGQTPFCKDRNPDRRSITELEFEEARALGIPTLLFLMDKDKHPIASEAEIELEPEKRAKLDAFRERAKRMIADSEVERVYGTFGSLEEFGQSVASAIGRLVQQLDSSTPDRAVAPSQALEPDTPSLPRAPELRALPNYAGSHEFIGREAEILKLGDWSAEADPSPMLLFEAMGGSGKSMLTWEWLTNHAPQARSDWAGQFWYSFYEKGAVMADFCRHALVYMTGRPMDEFAKRRTPELAELLLAQLGRKPWLVVLDGLERVLVAYHRMDAAQLRDEEAGTGEDQIGKRDPLQAIRPEDDDLLRRLANAAPSKILVTSRLTPAAVVNRAGTPLPGVRREILPGLRPRDAEKLFRACGVSGDSAAIQAFLQSNCNCHPLVIGALAGLVNNYVPAPGDFDRWLADPRQGGKLNFAELDLVQKRNHILDAALDALAAESRQLLQTLALLQGGADYEMLLAFNPHLPPKPEEVVEPRNPEELPWWRYENADSQATMQSEHAAASARRRAYLEALAAWEINPAVTSAPGRLDAAVRDLRRRGLLQYDGVGKRYDLHPVVRGVGSGRLDGAETERLGQKVVDHFNTRPHNSWEHAETLVDLELGLEIVRVLLRMKRYAEALEAYQGGLSNALSYNLDADFERQALLRPFFPDGWDAKPVAVDANKLSWLLNAAASAIKDTSSQQSMNLFDRMIEIDLRIRDEDSLVAGIRNRANLGRPAEALRLGILALEVSLTANNTELVFRSKLNLYADAFTRGDLDAADRLWGELDGMERPANRAIYRPGEAEECRAHDLFQRGELTEPFLAQAERLARDGRARFIVRSLHGLRGTWYLVSRRPDLAVGSLTEAVRMAREVGRPDYDVEAQLALARLRAGESFDGGADAERLDGVLEGSLSLAELWEELGKRDRAVAQALKYHAWAVGDGGPFVYRYHLDRCRALLTELGAELPAVPDYDPSAAKPFPWEAEVRRFIEELKEEKKAREAERSGETETGSETG